MHLRFLLDEDTERELASKLARGGHDVERVVALDELGAGTNDHDIRSYARRANRIIVTYDDHHVAAPSSDHAGVFYCPNQRLDAFTVYRIISTILEYYDSRSALPPVVYVSENWL